MAISSASASPASKNSFNTTLGVSQMVDHFPEALSAKSMSGCNVMPWSETQDLTVRQVTNSSKRIRLTL